MEDDELQAIRAARMAELRGGGGSSASSGGASGSSGFSGPQGASNGGSGGKNQEEQQAQQEEMKRQMLSRILDTEARERLSRIGLVKPQKARQITDLLIRMAQSGQIRGKIKEEQLIDLLDQVDQANAAESGAGKITFTRKKTVQDDDDSDFDL
ncbi:PDCD5-related protein [Kalmanozyma brasiliensis GHG001]|uniref:Programmed cell death protein 5 n=1 Tax=Kalmanozyma brasiliensis (strain GHG001) TaxID=1365824 RepID=V5ENV4_KALBG|nr:PDCD5-related protein [Kalmanozyma brasiliensis GHG001]EST04603.1 PDCD5-related protein [Kalmanozyma brasiliensis GHG001]